VVRERLRVPRQAAVPLEGRACASVWDGEGRLHHWLSVQAPHSVKRVLAGLFGIEAERVHVIAPDVGGGFGPKMADLAGRVGDGINLPLSLARSTDLVSVARRAHEDGGRDPERFLVTVSASFTEDWLRPGRRAELGREGIDRIVLVVRPRFDRARIEAAAPLLAGDGR